MSRIRQLAEGQGRSFWRAHRRTPLLAPARCGAFADERRVVVGDEG